MHPIINYRDEIPDFTVHDDWIHREIPSIDMPGLLILTLQFLTTFHGVADYVFLFRFQYQRTSKTF